MIRYIHASFSAATAKKIAHKCALCGFALTVLCSGITAAEAAQRERIMPVRTSASVAQPGPEQAQPVPVCPAPPAPSVSSPRATFSDDPLALSRRPASDRGAEEAADGQKRANVVYAAAGQRREEPLTLGDDGRVSVSVTRRKAPESRLEPAHTLFSGGENTLPYMGMDADPLPEINVQYQLRDNAAARLTVNPQDSSPLHRPVESGGRMNVAGVYMDMDLTPDVRFQVGGESHSVETRDAQAGVAQGAAVSLQWNF